MYIGNLRVGNIVIGKRYDENNVGEPFIVKIRSIGRENVGKGKYENEWVVGEDTFFYSLKELQEIDLNSKWLLKMGFKKVDGSSTYKYYHNRLAIVFDYSDNTLTIMKHSRTIFEKYVDYVHEMQNVLEMFEIEIPM